MEKKEHERQHLNVATLLAHQYPWKLLATRLPPRYFDRYGHKLLLTHAQLQEMGLIKIGSTKGLTETVQLADLSLWFGTINKNDQFDLIMLAFCNMY